MKSKDISLGLLLFVAGTCFACGSPSDIKRCVDKDNMIVGDDKCLGAPASGGYGSHPYGWYYGGYGGYGQKATGGYMHPASGVSYHTGSSKGGFGGSAGVHGAGGDGHGGGVAG